MKTLTLPNRTGLIAGAVVAIGILLWMFVSKALIIVAALGAFGPGILREFGWLNDHDEYQRQAAHRAGYHAYLVVGLITAVLASFLSVEGQVVENPPELVQSLLLLLWLAWMFSSLMSYWGARKTASTLLLVFGSFWAVFIIASLVGGDPGSDPSLVESIMGVLFGILLISIFFVPAWAAHRWPRITGVVLLVAALGLVLLFYTGGRGGALQWTTILLTNSMLILPLLACGVALIRDKEEKDD